MRNLYLLSFLLLPFIYDDLENEEHTELSNREEILAEAEEATLQHQIISSAY
jgi:hypothetical protein